MVQTSMSLREVLDVMRRFALVPGLISKFPYIFMALWEGERLNVNQIVMMIAKESDADILLRHQTVRNWLNSMVEKGLIDRSKADGKGRSVTYKLTENGEILARAIMAAFRTIEEQMSEQG